MASVKYAAIGAMFELLWLSQLPVLLRRLSQSRGVIFTLHRVLPDAPAAFSPNAILQVRPDFLGFVIERLRALDIDIVSLDEAIERLAAQSRGRNFVVFTFDDAYRDNLQFALPILKANNCPFTLYVPTKLVDGVGEVWWQALEDIIARQRGIAIPGDGENELFDCASLAGKHQTYARLYGRMRQMPEADRVVLIRNLARDYGFDLELHCRSLIMDWQELRQFADDPLCIIGAHTVHHYELAKLPAEQARSEIVQSVDILKAQLGRAPTHLSYPIGGPASAGPREYGLARELGLRSAVTTRPGGLYGRHRDSLHALPRVSLNGLFQSRRYVDVFATGSLFTWLGKIGAA